MGLGMEYRSFAIGFVVLGPKSMKHRLGLWRGAEDRTFKTLLIKSSCKQIGCNEKKFSFTYF